MCTAISYETKDHYFGRNLDVEGSYREGVVITPRNYVFHFRYEQELTGHYSMIGMATVVEDYPLYFEATNEKGLSMAALNFPGNAFYYLYEDGKKNIAPFELIPYIIGQCSSTEEAEELLKEVNVVHCDFRKDIPLSPLHWMISDRDRSLVLECTEEGMKVYENPYGVLTNNPTFEYHRENMHHYMRLHEGLSENSLSPSLPLKNISLGFGAMGLPGDFSSSSRFVKAVFVKEKSICDGTEKESINQFFHILQSVAMPKGCVRMGNGAFEYTRYSCCCNTDTQVYYYNTYYNSLIRKVELSSSDPEESKLQIHPIKE